MIRKTLSLAILPTIAALALLASPNPADAAPPSHGGGGFRGGGYHGGVYHGGYYPHYGYSYGYSNSNTYSNSYRNSHSNPDPDGDSYCNRLCSDYGHDERGQ